VRQGGEDLLIVPCVLAQNTRSNQEGDSTLWIKLTGWAIASLAVNRSI
jgi:hypothetical protein